MNIWFDMDGTIADLYGVEGWLDMLEASDPLPYEMALPLVNLSRLARALHKAQKKGHRVGIISWTSKRGTPAYNAAVEVAKLKWLARHLPSVQWDKILIVPYGTPKGKACGRDNRGKMGVLFDDEERNRQEWEGTACAPDAIFETLSFITNIPV